MRVHSVEVSGEEQKVLADALNAINKAIPAIQDIANRIPEVDYKQRCYCHNTYKVLRHMQIMLSSLLENHESE